MSNEQYKKYIIELLERIEDNEGLSRIYNLVHRTFINQ